MDSWCPPLSLAHSHEAQTICGGHQHAHLRSSVSWGEPVVPEASFSLVLLYL